ncbi:hypothetical protein Tco_1132615 [Tanacetum coccineum]|uniref:Uncharacterized protein n=1 Tax=Tanacetum coccineum TaxID=301880 RepID=A0ABQ5JD24_9ASTR
MLDCHHLLPREQIVIEFKYPCALVTTIEEQELAAIFKQISYIIPSLLIFYQPILSWVYLSREKQELTVEKFVEQDFDTNSKIIKYKASHAKDAKLSSCMLYDHVSGMYKIVHVSKLDAEKKNKPIAGEQMIVRVGCQILEIRNGLSCGTWNRVNVPEGFQRWEKFLSEGVITKSKYLYWDVRSENFVVRLNVESGVLTKVYLPRQDWLIINQQTGNIRYLFEDRYQLLFFYCGNQGTRVLKIDNNLLTWEQVVTIQHQLDKN